jgi:ribosomal protein L32
MKEALNKLQKDKKEAQRKNKRLIDKEYNNVSEDLYVCNNCG